MRKILYFVCGLFVLCLISTGCERQHTPHNAINSDSDIEAAVEEKLKNDTTIDASDIDVEVKDGVVTLKGELDTQAELDRAVQIAQSIPNVKSVNSNLQAEPVLTNEDVKERVKANEEKAEEQREEGDDRSVTDATQDATITSKVKLAFAKDDQVSALRIDVDTKDGQVTLTGNVKSEAEARRAIQIAESVEGVKRVTSVLTVKP